MHEQRDWIEAKLVHGNLMAKRSAIPRGALAGERRFSTADRVYPRSSAVPQTLSATEFPRMLLSALPFGLSNLRQLLGLPYILRHTFAL